MFETEEYGIINNPDNIQLEIEDIEDDIFSDINNLLKDRFDRLFLTDKFKCNGRGIDIIYPGISYPGNRSLIKGPDHIRFLLSLYPHKERLKNIDRIILQPRHVEINNIELVSVYIRREKILVLYLHHPHSYTLDGTEDHEYSFMPFFFPQFVNNELSREQGAGPGKVISKIPPLWYILSIVSFSPDNKIDKFFIIDNEKREKNISENLEKTSLFYSRYGY